jgi:hypothetical protein
MSWRRHTKGYPARYTGPRKMPSNLSPRRSWPCLDREQTILDAAFFLLAFGQVERCINALASVRLQRDRERAAIRQVPFERRLQTALADRTRRGLRNEISSWYDIRNRVAHGELVASAFNLAAVFTRCRELEIWLSAG